jgi:hypothetical protein
MRLRESFSRAGFAVVAIGLAASLALTVQACGSDGGTGMKPIVSPGGQTAAQPQLPSLDLNVPAGFQTAAFAYG